MFNNLFTLLKCFDLILKAKAKVFRKIELHSKNFLIADIEIQQNLQRNLQKIPLCPRKSTKLRTAARNGFHDGSLGATSLINIFRNG